MISLANYLLSEAKALLFANDEKGIKAFCDYVFLPKFTKYIINPDLTITLEQNCPSKIAYMQLQDLTEIPEFIIFNNVQNLKLGITSNKKLKKWAPKVIGGCAGIVIHDDDKLEILDLSECDINGGLFHIVNTNIKSIIGGVGRDVQLRIQKNKRLSELNLSNYTGYVHGSYITNNRSLIVKKNQVPKKVDDNHIAFVIEKNKGGYETFGSLTIWDKE